MLAKGIDLGIKAFLKGDFAKHGWTYAIAGTGPLEEELKAMAGDEAGKGIRFLGFQQPADNLSLMAHADLFLLPSRYEPHGIVIAEAAASGTPIVASDVCGAAADLVMPGVNGTLFRSEDAEDLQEKLEMLMNDPERLMAMRGATRAVFEDWFARTSPVKVADRVAREMLAKRKQVHVWGAE